MRAQLGIVCGIALGRNCLPTDVLSIYIKIANSVPRVALGAEFLITRVEDLLLKWRPPQFSDHGI